MLESPNYVASKDKGELVPQLTLNKFDNPDDEWSWWEKLQIVFKMFLGDEFGIYSHIIFHFFLSQRKTRQIKLIEEKNIQSL